MSKQQQHDCNNNKNNQPNRAPSAETWLCVMKPFKASLRSTNQRDFEKTCFLLPLPLSLSFPRVIDRDSRTNSCVRVCVCTQLSSGGIFIYPLPLSFSLSRLLENINLLLLSVIERREGERKKKGLRNYQQRWLLLLGRDFFCLSFFLSCMWKQVSGHVSTVYVKENQTAESQILFVCYINLIQFCDLQKNSLNRLSAK